MRIPAPPPGFAIHGGALSCVSRGDVAANAIGGGPATAAPALAVLHHVMQGMPCGHDAMNKAAALAERLGLAFEATHAGLDLQFVSIGPSSLADSRAQMFEGDRPCP